MLDMMSRQLVRNSQIITFQLGRCSGQNRAWVGGKGEGGWGEWTQCHQLWADTYSKIQSIMIWCCYESIRACYVNNFSVIYFFSTLHVYVLAVALFTCDIPLIKNKRKSSGVPSGLESAARTFGHRPTCPQKNRWARILARCEVCFF